ncbi:MAG: hypothetical protein KDA49_09165 [Rhodospirillaceae bacterium]|nr:hypothetical protein [Rhodospirillaceae bacterium]MCA8932624.1 hypothetical protein [Rhodospirillaceae bacterium]
MQITINVDCTPEEARVFLGLPDVQPLQRAVMAELEQRMRANLSAIDPETLMKTWLPLGLQNVEQVQRFFWTHLMGGGRSGDDSKGS